ncbi:MULTISPECIES: SchA/CurD-like domain-containing protein [Streptomyces]|uniref:Protein in whiE locus n=1 Tax=Streptomyces amritsarensis TaxID=681158 RepID=A0ABX3G880_9ACTN|nr:MULTISPECIES: SchA/CurD-like domain-containing protein [Streptomyces]AQT70962.1 protein in whiE locus [Streptomyces sp. fd1-xmd]MDX6761231.1 SchA/CurD-like domain-containing protein [Streptomyces sp. F8]OLZ72344.1 protein in whiE locus [Streptomyces amritsarensis]
MTTTLSERVSQSAFDGSMLRVVLLMDLHEGTQQRFFEAYEKLRNDIASVPGHISDQLCQSFENPSQWLITSEWESAPQYLAWVNSEHHAEQVRPLGACARSMRPLKFTVLRETGRGYDQASRPATARLQATPRLGAGIVRHALTFTVKPGSEKDVAAILSSYASPAARVDDHTRLCRTSLFMHGNRVVRTVEVQGDLMAALRHVSEQPEVRAVEEAINPYLEQDRDLGDPESARMFFMRAAVPAVHHIAAPEPESDEVQRHAIYYPAKPGCGQALARFLARQDEAAARRPTSPVRSSSIFQRDDIVVRLIDVRGPLKADPETVYGVSGPRKAAVLDRLTVASGGRGRAAHHTMNLITDRRAPAQS